MDERLFRRLQSHLRLYTWLESINGRPASPGEAPRLTERFVVGFRLQNVAPRLAIANGPGVVFLRPHVVIEADGRFARFDGSSRRQIALFFPDERLMPGQSSTVQQGFIATGELSDFDDEFGPEPIADVYPVATLDYERFFQISAHQKVGIEIEGRL